MIIIMIYKYKINYVRELKLDLILSHLHSNSASLTK